MTEVITIIGSVGDIDTFFCQSVAKRFQANYPEFTVDFQPIFECDYFIQLANYKKKHGSDNPSLQHHNVTHLVLLNDEYIGDVNALIDLAEETYSIKGAGLCNTVIFNREMREESYRQAVILNRKHPIVYLEYEDLGDNDQIQLGKIFIELYSEVCPKACENFIKLCTANEESSYNGYVGCKIHRIVKGGWLQCGDVVDGTGKNSLAHHDESKDGSKTIPDESFAVDLGNPMGGVIGYANTGPHSNGSQFFITMGPCEWMNTKFVGFGRVLQGWSTLKAMEAVESSNQTPIRPLTITKAGMGLDILAEQKNK